MRCLTLATAVLLTLSLSLDAKRRKRIPRVPPMVVTPSAEIDARVAEEISKADALLADIANAPDLFHSTFVVSTIYYRDGFLSDFPEDKIDAHPSRRIVSHISRKLNAVLRAQYLQRVTDAYSNDVSMRPSHLTVPVAAPLPKKARRRTHQWAVDLFADEGSPVVSASRGVVVLADHFWTASDPFSSSSAQGGNSVIVFDPVGSHFYRYCHLGDVEVVAGMLVQPGDRLGSVGHSGWNAARPGHGRHLHWEVNVYSNGTVQALKQEALLSLLRSAIPPALAQGQSFW